MFIGAALLTGNFINFNVAFSCYLFALATEILDIQICKRVLMEWAQRKNRATLFIPVAA